MNRRIIKKEIGFLSPIMEELTELPSDFYISTECTGGKKLQAQTTRLQADPPSAHDTRISKKSDDLVLQNGQQREENKVSTFIAHDENQLQSHPLPIDAEESPEQLTLASEYPAHCSSQMNNPTRETSCDSEKNSGTKEKSFHHRRYIIGSGDLRPLIH